MSESTYVLESAVRSYPVFEPNQVLTAMKLNQVTNYLDYQLHATRAQTIGTGIVCGLKVTCSSGKVNISKGAAITTDGDLLSLSEDMTFTRRVRFSDTQSNYPPFKKSASSKIEMWELVESGGGSALPALGQLSKMGIVLYLESYEHDPDTCTIVDCNNLGKTRENHLRVLLVPQNDLARLLTSIPSLDTARKETTRIACRRVVLTKDASTKLPALRKAYLDASGVMLRELRTQLSGVVDNNNSQLRHLFDQDVYKKWKDTLDGRVKMLSQRELNAQYVYDAVRDMVVTYNEFADLLCEAGVICCASLGGFPKHVLLGTAAGATESGGKPCRHRFYPAADTSAAADLMRRARFTADRLGYLINTLIVPPNNATIRFTPSILFGQPLGRRAMPYYYDYTELRPYWSYEHTRCGITGQIQSYHARDDGDESLVKNPWPHCFSQFPFYRIEGHIGRDWQEVRKNLLRQIGSDRLPIKVLFLQLEQKGEWREELEQYVPEYLTMLYGLLRDIVRDYLKESAEQVEEAGKKMKIAAETEDDDSGTYRVAASSGKERADKFVNKAKGVKELLAKSLIEVDLDSLQLEVIEAVKDAGDYQEKAGTIAKAANTTPVENLINGTATKQMLLLNKLLKEKRERIIRSIWFSSFLALHPGLEHFAGVERGGTFIVVYSHDSGEVVADFCLPYRCEIEPEKLPDIKLTPPQTRTRPWGEKYRFEMTDSPERTTDKKISALEKELQKAINAAKGSYEERLSGVNDLIARNLIPLLGGKDLGVKGPTLPGGGKSNPYGGTIDVLDSVDSALEVLRRKKAAEGLSPEEKEMESKLEATGSELLVDGLKMAASEDEDVKADSSTVEFVSRAARFSKNVTDKKAKKTITTAVNKMKSNAELKTKKPVLTRWLGDF